MESFGKSANRFDLLAKMAMSADTINAARAMMVALDVKAKSVRVKQFHHNTLHSLYELIGSMGLDDPQLLCPNMLKRRTSDGLLESAPGIVPPLDNKQLVDNHASGIWQRWWHLADAERFYVEDNCTPKPQIAVVNL